ncbi:aminotransferase class V-fold PLP-dependent enzyme [Bradyrhizobium sp. DASA03120]|uniref:aminotransferase class V-fold PLP-dependent enzyme n=1 Tax=Bradyrhizobium sp. SMVTL-02 TaxID=3395917 RepID=UPI003F6E50B6
MMIDPRTAYLNSAAFGPLPREVLSRVTALRRYLAEDPADFQLRRVPSLLWEARERLAGFIGGDPNRLLLTTNATTAINLVASSLALEAPGEILMTDQEYETMRWCWERSARRLGLTVRTVTLPELPESAEEVFEAVHSAIGPQTRLLFISHILSATGLVMPARSLCIAARERGIVTVVDGAQAPGLIDLKLEDMNCDFYAGSCHKWLLGPMGTGFLYFGSSKMVGLEPLQVSWGYRGDLAAAPLHQRDRFGSTPALRRLECEGTRDLCPWLALPSAIDFHAALGMCNIEARRHELTCRVRDRLCGELGFGPATPASRSLSGAIVSFRMPDGTDAPALRQALFEGFAIETSLIERSHDLILRVSTHFFNNQADIDRLTDALRDLLGHVQGI